MTAFTIVTKVPAKNGGFRTFVFETDWAQTVTGLTELLNAGHIVAGKRISRARGGERIEMALGRSVVGEIHPVSATR